MAGRKGFTFDASGLHRSHKLFAKNEEEIYAALGLPLLPRLMQHLKRRKSVGARAA
jgi:DNA polymerase/3'-5' exonuclease PolX